MLRYAHDCNQNQNVNISKNTSKLTPQTLPNDLQNRHFGHPETHLGTLYEPRLDFLLKIVISGYPQGDPLGALGQQKGTKSMKIRKKLRLKTIRENNLEIITIPDPPKPQKAWFRLDETHGFTNTAYPLKVTKMTPKWLTK